MSRRMYVPFHADGHHQPVRGLRRARGARLGRATAPSTPTSSAWTGSSRPRATTPTATSWPSRPTRSCCSSCSPTDELRRLFDRLGYDYDPDLARRTIDYYDRRTSHGSTLSLVTYAGVLAGLDPESSWERFLVALDSDIGDVQGGTTKEGIHMGVMSGTLDLLQRSYVGSSVRDGVLHFAAAAHRPARRPRVLACSSAGPRSGSRSRATSSPCSPRPKGSARRCASASATRFANWAQATAACSHSPNSPTQHPQALDGGAPARRAATGVPRQVRTRLIRCCEEIGVDHESLVALDQGRAELALRLQNAVSDRLHPP